MGIVVFHSAKAVGRSSFRLEKAMPFWGRQSSKLCQTHGVDTCIYCRRSGADISFTRDHVMPEAFGKFRDNLVLSNGEVCRDCNQVLGDEVETAAVRGSVEAAHRFQNRKRLPTKKPNAAESFAKAPRNRVTFEMDEPGWDSAKLYLEPIEDGTDVSIRIRPQIIVQFDDGHRRAFCLEELADPHVLKRASRYRACAESEEGLKAIAAALEPLGVQPAWQDVKKLEPNESGIAKISVCATYDDISRRLVAKIAFNFLAHLLRAPFVLKEEFDAIRLFIRYGQGVGSEFVSVEDRPVLGEEQNSGRWRMTDAHLVTLDRSPTNALLGHVSIFNMIHNKILLCRTDPEIIDSGLIPTGRLFCWDTSEILPLLAWDDRNLVQPPEVLAQRSRRRR
jgi:hypothetical protein